MGRQIRVEVKPGVLLLPSHFYTHHVGLIVRAVEDQWPESSDLIVITRGAEQVPTGATHSKHLIGKAFDFRTKHLDPIIDREALIKRILNDSLLGMDYYGYFKRIPDGKGGFVEWLHINYNR